MKKNVTAVVLQKINSQVSFIFNPNQTVQKFENHMLSFSRFYGKLKSELSFKSNRFSKTHKKQLG